MTASRTVAEPHAKMAIPWAVAVTICALLVLAGLPAQALPVLILAAAFCVFVVADTSRGIPALAFAIVPLGAVQAEIATVTLNLPEVLLLLLFTKECLLFLLRGERPAKDAPWTGILLYAAAAAIAAATGLLHGNGARAVFQDARQFTEYLLLFLLILHRVNTVSEARRILLAFALGAALAAAHGVLQRYTAFGIPGKQLISDLVFHGAVRSGSFYGATPLGAIMVLALGPTLGLLWCTHSRFTRAALFVLAALLVTAAIFTKTRASWLAIGLLLAVFFFGIRKTPRIVLAAATAVLVFAALLGPEVAQRMGTLSFGKAERSLRMRVQYYATAAHIARAAPVFGLGWGCYYAQGDILANERYVERDRHERPAGAPRDATVHSAYLQLLVKSGLLGLGAFIVLLLGCAAKCLRHCARGCRGAPSYPLFLGVTASLCGYLFHAGLENFFQWPVMAQSFWLLLGCAIVLARQLEVAESGGGTV